MSLGPLGGPIDEASDPAGRAVRLAPPWGFPPLEGVVGEEDLGGEGSPSDGIRGAVIGEDWASSPSSPSAVQKKLFDLNRRGETSTTRK
jgi:hypothetical protein